MQPLVGPGPGMMMGPPMGGMPPRVGEGMMGLPSHIPKSMPPPGPMQPQSLKSRMNTILRDKEKIITMEENPAKRILSEPLRLLCE